jgi:hypothetical protein
VDVPSVTQVRLTSEQRLCGSDLFINLHHLQLVLLHSIHQQEQPRVPLVRQYLIRQVIHSLVRHVLQVRIHQQGRLRVLLAQQETLLKQDHQTADSVLRDITLVGMHVLSLHHQASPKSKPPSKSTKDMFGFLSSAVFGTLSFWVL